MPRCPVCDSPRVIIVLNRNRSGLCASCGARWIQDGDMQRNVQAPPDAQATGAR